MFGSYRTLLALLVVIHHLNWVPLIGPFAVHGFFVLSGYLMTLILHRHYGYDRRGFLGFVGNRALRLFPSYLAVLALTVLVIATIGADPVRQFRSPMYLPSTPGEWFQNLTMVYVDWFPNAVRPRLSPATWALTLELFNYLLLALGISRSKWLTWIWCAASAGYHACAVVLGWGHDYIYLHILSGSLPFAIGALIFHYRGALQAPVLPVWLVSLGGTFAVIALSFVGARFGAESLRPLYLVCFYGNMIAAAGAIALLANVQGNQAVDRQVGNLSYHIYIAHWIVGAVIFTQILGVETPVRSMSGYGATAATIAACAALSLALTRFIDEPVETLRRRLRPRSTSVGTKSENIREQGRIMAP